MNGITTTARLTRSTGWHSALATALEAQPAYQQAPKGANKRIVRVLALNSSSEGVNRERATRVAVKAGCRVEMDDFDKNPQPTPRGHHAAKVAVSRATKWAEENGLGTRTSRWRENGSQTTSEFTFDPAIVALAKTFLPVSFELSSNDISEVCDPLRAFNGQAKPFKELKLFSGDVKRKEQERFGEDAAWQRRAAEPEQPPERFEKDNGNESKSSSNSGLTAGLEVQGQEPNLDAAAPSPRVAEELLGVAEEPYVLAIPRGIGSYRLPPE